MNHDELRTAMRLWVRLEEARNIVAESRSSVLLSVTNVDSVTMQIVGLQARVLDCIRKDEIPPMPKMKMFGG